MYIYATHCISMQGGSTTSTGPMSSPPGGGALIVRDGKIYTNHQSSSFETGPIF